MGVDYEGYIKGKDAEESDLRSARTHPFMRPGPSSGIREFAIFRSLTRTVIWWVSSQTGISVKLPLPMQQA